MSFSSALFHPTGQQQANPELSDKAFRTVAAFLRRESGIELGDAKRTLVQTRLRKLVVSGGHPSYEAYIDATLKSGGQPLIDMIDVLTTNKTSFFREPDHFQFIQEQWLPSMELRIRSGRPLRIWSAACSMGHEPYTLAMVLLEEAKHDPRLKFEILATDLSTRVLKTAHKGIYPAIEIEPVPAMLREQYLLRARSTSDSRVAVGPELRRVVKFQRFNLITGDYDFPHAFDLILCRNVMIYFSHDNRERIVNRMHAVMRPGAHLMVGHSESLGGVKTPLQYVAPTIYARELEG